MSTLIIDTSSNRTLVGLIVGERVEWEECHDGATDHGEVLPILVSRALHCAVKISSDIDGVMVGMGPGPYTGLRIGIVFGQTFARARGISWIGKCSLDAIVIPHHSKSKSYIVTTDARRKEIYWAKYEDGKRTVGPAVGSITDINELSEPKFGFGFGEIYYPSAWGIFTAQEKINEPLYLRRPDAVPTLERRP